MAAHAEDFAEAISPALPRSGAETLTAELLPLLDACRFLERNAERLLRPRKLGRGGRPFWLRGVEAEISREPLGEVLVIGPANFPLFLPGVQVLQALAAGNRVVWKPGAGGSAVARLMAQALLKAGLPEGQLEMTDESVEAAQEALASQASAGQAGRGPDKVVFTGSREAGADVLQRLAHTATPATMELSGADAVVVMPGADLAVTARAIAFGLRLNGGQVCMSPRRLFAEAATLRALLPLLERELAKIAPVPLTARTAGLLSNLLEQAQRAGARVRDVSSGSGGAETSVDAAAQRPLLVLGARPEMQIARADIFAPVLSVLELPSLAALPEAYAACEFGLTVAIFCARAEERSARLLARLLRAGTVLINDLIAPTADPRVPFGGRGASGYGVTRGAEGLLEMTAPKVLLVRRSGRMRHLEPTGQRDVPLLASLIGVSHGGGWRARWSALRSVATLGRSRKA